MMRETVGKLRKQSIIMSFEHQVAIPGYQTAIMIHSNERRAVSHIAAELLDLCCEDSTWRTLKRSKMWHRLSSLLRQHTRRQRAAEIKPKPLHEATEHLQDAASQSTHVKPSTTLTRDEAHRAALNQLIEDWLNAPLAREQRQLLLQHDDLLAPEAESVLLETIEQYRDRQVPDMMQELHERLRLLAEVRRAGGDADAITYVYVNLEGGLALDVPPWLNDLERQLTHLPHTEGLHASAPNELISYARR